MRIGLEQSPGRFITFSRDIRECGGNVIASPTRTNPNHATLSGLTPDTASQLFRPTVANPSRRTTN
jgi:hypothetical protein